MNDPLHERGQALENVFFRQRDQELLKALKAKLETGDPVAELRAASGIEDAEVLQSLVDSGVNGVTLSAVGLIPLVTVAWADREMEQRESKAILDAASHNGIDADSPAYELLQQWLGERPEAELFEIWKDYVAALKPTLSLTAFSQLRDKVAGRSRQVAESAGGLLGIGTISDVERKVLEQIEAAFA